VDVFVEVIQVRPLYAAVQTLIPQNVAVGEVIEKGIVKINQRDELLEAHYYVTNTKIPTEDTILAYRTVQG
jgi:hypothetical protein